MLLASLAISGFPGFSGFFSKDEILWKAFSSGHIVLWLIGVITAGMTALYMFRLMFMTFCNENRSPKEIREHIHEAPKSMTVPMIILGVLSVIGGYIGVPHALGGSNIISNFLEPSVAHTSHHAEHHSLSMEYMCMGASTIIVFIGIFLAYYMYVLKRDLPTLLANRFKLIYNLLFNKWYVDELYSVLAVRPLYNLSIFFWRGVDVLLIDGAVNGVAYLVNRSGGWLRALQVGQVQVYAVSILLGTVAMVIYSALVFI